MYIENDTLSDAEEWDIDAFVEIVKNRRKKGKYVPDGFSEEKLAQLREENATKQANKILKPPSQVPVSKPKPKSKKQKAAEQRRREKEMEAIANDLAEKQKLDERTEKKKLAEQDKQNHTEEEKVKQAAEEKKKKEKEEKERLERLKRDEEETERQQEEDRKKKEDKKKKQAQKAKVDQKPKEEQMKQQQAAKRLQQTVQQPQQRYPREVPPRFMQQQKQQAHKQKQQQGLKKSGQSDADFANWTDPNNGWDKVIVDERDKEAWPSISDSHSENTSEVGDDSASISGSVISSSSNPGYDQSQGSHASLGQSSGSSMQGSNSAQSLSEWSAGNSSNSASNGRMDSNNWSITQNGNPSGLTNMNSTAGQQGGVSGNGTTGNPQMTTFVSNQGLMQQTLAIGEGSSSPMNCHASLPTSNVGWGNNVIGNRPHNPSSQPSLHNMEGNKLMNSSGAQMDHPNGHNNYLSGHNGSTSNNMLSNWRPMNFSSGVQQPGNNSTQIAPSTIAPALSTPTSSSNGAPTNNHNGWNIPGNVPNSPANIFNNVNYSNGINNSNNGVVDTSNINTGSGNNGSNCSNSNVWQRNGTLQRITGDNSGKTGNGWGEPTQNCDTPGWGNPTPQNNQSQWGVNPNNNSNSNTPAGISNQPHANPSKPHNTWAQAAGKGLNINNNSSNNINNSNNNNSTSTTSNSNTNSTTSSQQNNSAINNNNGSQNKIINNEIDRLINCNEGWGKVQIKQDSPWVDLEETPPDPKNTGTSIWVKNTMNTNTGAWESGNKNSTSSWGVNVEGGASGDNQWEDEDDMTNVWTGVPTNTSNNTWSNQNASSNTWVGNNQEKNKWGSANQNTNTWGSNVGGSESGTWGSTAKQQSGWNNPSMGSESEIKPSGWEEPSPPVSRRGIPHLDNGTAIWGNPTSQGKVAKWRDMPNPSPTTASNSAPNTVPTNSQSSMPNNNPVSIINSPTTPTMSTFRIPPPIKPDPGTSVWGTPPAVPKNSNWGETVPNESTGSSGWEDTSPQAKANPGNSWGEPGSPAPGPTPGSSTWGVKPKNAAGSTWSDSQMDTTWAASSIKQGAKPLTKDLIWASKQFRILTEMGFKKEDVESALRNHSMNLEGAIVSLLGDLHIHAGATSKDLTDMDNVGRGGSKRMNDDDSGQPDATQFVPPLQNTPTFAGHGLLQNAAPLSNTTLFSMKPNTNSLLSNANSSLNLSNTSSISPALIQKILSQQQQIAVAQPGHVPGQAIRSGGMNQPNPQVQAVAQQIANQLRMAVNAGHINSAILNQPLAPHTLHLINQLLAQLNNLQKYNSHHHFIQASKNPMLQHQLEQSAVNITKTKQQIVNLQNQIAVHQARYVKQQHILKGEDPLPGLANDFQALGMKEQSRLAQWKLPASEKDIEDPSNFSKAPGTISKSMSQSHSTPNLQARLDSLANSTGLSLMPGDNTWSSSLSRTHSDTGWPDSKPTESSNSDSKESQWPSSSSTSQTSTTYSFTDLVPEFEPGKPWKGPNMTNIEDDPHITPGSVARSPLSVNTIKDSDIFSLVSGQNKSSPVSTDSSFTSGISSSAWSHASSSSFGLSISNTSAGFPKLSKANPSAWTSIDSASHPPTSLTSELWGAPLPKNVTTPTRPPPGLTNQNKSSSWMSNNSNQYLSRWTSGNERSAFTSVRGTSWDRADRPSTWLLLRNLTPQIDGSTLKTLCMQHGPLQTFYLSLNQGSAMVCYSTVEEAMKAKEKLNTCVLGNTTILAEFATGTDIDRFFQSGLLPPAGNNSGNFRSVGTASMHGFNKTENSQWNGASLGLHSSPLWPLQSGSSAASLWGTTSLDHDHRATPSLNSFLPGDLLGGESV